MTRPVYRLVWRKFPRISKVEDKEVDGMCSDLVMLGKSPPENAPALPLTEEHFLSVCLPPLLLGLSLSSPSIPWCCLPDSILAMPCWGICLLKRLNTSISAGTVLFLWFCKEKSSRLLPSTILLLVSPRDRTSTQSLNEKMSIKKLF